MEEIGDSVFQVIEQTLLSPAIVERTLA